MIILQRASKVIIVKKKVSSCLYEMLRYEDRCMYWLLR